MRRLAVTLVGLAAVTLCAVAVASAVEVDSKAQKITFTGRIQPLWSYTSDDGVPSNYFLLRRARMAMKMKINDWVSGMVEADFGEGTVALKDAYFKAEPADDFEIIAGQTKRRFDLFELVSSAQMLVIERDGRIGERHIPSYSFLTEDLGYADRDIGLFVGAKLADEMVQLDAAVTNGSGENTFPTIGEKAFQGRMTLAPLRERDFDINVGVSAHPYSQTATDVGYALAVEGSAEYGSYSEGTHVQAGVVGGKNWRHYDPVSDKAPTFVAVQGILSHKHKLANPTWFESVEPLFRVSWADPDGDVDKDDGLLLTPGINLWASYRTRLALDADIFVPSADDIPGTTLDESATALGLKVASWIFF